MALQTKDILRILAVGDVVGVGAVDFLERRLRRLRDKLHADLVVVNAENAAEAVSYTHLDVYKRQVPFVCS